MGKVQGEKGISLTGFLSCTIDSMEIGGGNGRLGLSTGLGAMEGKEKQTTNAFHLEQVIEIEDLKEIKDQSE